MESSDKTVTWKYTTVGWPSNFGARFLSYVFDGVGNISGNDRLDSTCDTSSALSVLFLKKKNDIKN